MYGEMWVWGDAGAEVRAVGPGGGMRKRRGRREMWGGGDTESCGGDGENREPWGGGGHWGSVGSHEAGGEQGVMGRGGGKRGGGDEGRRGGRAARRWGAERGAQCWGSRGVMEKEGAHRAGEGGQWETWDGGNRELWG